MNELLHTELFALLLVVGTYLAAGKMYKKTGIRMLHPLITSVFVIIFILKMLQIDYQTFATGSRLIQFMLGPSVVALGFVLDEQLQS